MKPSGSSQSIPFRSKKPLGSSSGSKKPDPPSVSLATPEKNLSRSRNRGIALSLKEVRQAAQTKRSQGDDDDAAVEIKSARKQILDWPGDSSACKPKNASKIVPEKLPERYEILGEFFEGLDSAIRLSKLKRSSPTFSKISAKIECLTDRRFTYAHLAQLKHILPEAIELKRVMILDERTSCMKPELHVSLIVDAIEYDEKMKAESKNMSLRKVFRARLADFIKSHPEGDEIPQEVLPDPFNRMQNQDICSNVREALSLQKGVGESVEEHNPVVASHISQSSQRRYNISSNEKTISASVILQGKSSMDPLSKEQEPPACSSPAKLVPSCPPATPIKASSYIEEISSTPVKVGSNLVKIASTPVKSASTPVMFASTPEKYASTPPKLASTPARLMSATPAARPPPKRSYCMSPDGDSVNSPAKLARRRMRTRSLKFESHEENEQVEEDTNEQAEDKGLDIKDVSTDDDDLGILPQSLLQSIQEQEKRVMEEQDPAISQAKRRRKMISCLPKLFNIIHFLFQSINRSVITKEELQHKIIAGHSDIVDQREVEEQLNLLLELVPEWISEKQSYTGDLLICINKMSAPESMRARLEEENRQASASAS